MVVCDRMHGPDAVNAEQNDLYKSIETLFFFDDQNACTVSSMVSREEMKTIFEELKARSCTPTRTQQILYMIFYKVYEHRGISKVIDNNLDVVWSKFVTMHPRMVPIFELLFSLQFFVKHSCGTYFEWEPFFRTELWFINEADMEVEPAIAAMDWHQPKVCVEQCGINPRYLGLPPDPSNPWQCRHKVDPELSCPCQCLHPYDADTDTGFCHEGACVCGPSKCTHKPKDIHSALAKMLFENVQDEENEVVYQLLYGNRNPRYKSDWKDVSELLKKEKLSMELIVRMIKAIYKTWFGLHLTTTLSVRGGARARVTHWCIGTGQGPDAHNRPGKAVQENEKQMSLFRFAMLKFGLDEGLFEVMLGAAATRAGISNKRACLDSLYRSLNIRQDNNPFGVFVNQAWELGDFDPNENVVNIIDNPVQDANGCYTPYSRLNHARVVSGVYQTSGLGLAPSLVCHHLIEDACPPQKKVRRSR